MHKFIQALGGAIVLVGLLVAGAALSRQSGVATNTPMMGLLIAAAIALPGAVLYCFGAIVEHLIAIRQNTERQLVIFESLGKKRDV